MLLLLAFLFAILMIKIGFGILRAGVRMTLSLVRIAVPLALIAIIAFIVIF